MPPPRRGRSRSSSPPPKRSRDRKERSRSPVASRDRDGDRGGGGVAGDSGLDDEHACRTLYLGNLDPRIEARDLTDVFDRYGVVEDIDIKRAPDYAYAFVRFANLDMALTAKQKEAGAQLRGYRMTIGFGKPHESRRLFVGGLGKFTSFSSACCRPALSLAVSSGHGQLRYLHKARPGLPCLWLGLVSLALYVRQSKSSVP